VHHLRSALRDLARRSLLPVGVAALLIAGLLGMHAIGSMPGMHSASGAPAITASAPASAAPVQSDSAQGCPGCATDHAGAMVMCGMVLLAAVGLASASTPGILNLLAPALLRRTRRVLRSLGEPRPSLFSLSISRT
jgi:hypothetical protein